MLERCGWILVMCGPRSCIIKSKVAIIFVAYVLNHSMRIFKPSSDRINIIIENSYKNKKGIVLQLTIIVFLCKCEILRSLTARQAEL